MFFVATTPARGKRQLAGMFMELVDRADWPEYYEIIPEPRCINGVRASVEKNRYKDPINAYTDLSLVFWNALFYNEPGSQIALDAETLKNVLETEWQKRPVLPTPRHSPPPSSPQKVHGTLPNPPPQSDPSKSTHLTAKQSSSAQPAPPASGTMSTNAHLPSKPAPPRPTTPVQPPSPDVMDVDVQGMSPEPDGQTDTTAAAAAGEDRDGDSEAIIRQLEKTLPRWEGLGDLGWMSEVTQERRLEIVVAIKSHKDVVIAFDRLPTLLQRILISTWHDCLRKHVGSMNHVRNPTAMSSSSRHSPPLSPPSGPPYTSPTHFASIRAGPGTARPLHTASDADGVPGITTFRVSTKDRTFVDEVHYKGWTIRLADWLHLSNPDDPSRPIVGHVFKCWISDEVTKKGQPGLSICWYYRPEQTFHLAHTQFMDKEVFKTSLFADHPVEDVLEKIAVQFTARHIRGRPSPPFWYPGWPLYVCHSRYNERERVFVKIKNWASCIPEEVRKKDDFMPIHAFERLVYPPKFPSPFVGASPVKGPGGIGEPLEKPEGEKTEGGGTGRKRTRRHPGTAETGTSNAVVASKMAVNAGTSSGLGALVSKAYPGGVLVVPGPGLVAAGASGDTKDRTMVTAAGTLSVPPIVDKLPPETTVHFDRSPDTNEVLWFSAPPMNMARPTPARHSLTYLAYLARKRKAEDVDPGSEGGGEDGDW
ncbi:hypothetical protein JVU11DRAFT_9591 [Chiua virens]|nr:hypothetical protein JVU11DRAFT_9591 [Chiua virens]